MSKWRIPPGARVVAINVFLSIALAATLLATGGSDFFLYLLLGPILVVPLYYGRWAFVVIGLVSWAAAAAVLHAKDVELHRLLPRTGIPVALAIFVAELIFQTTRSRRRTQEALRQASESLSAIVASAPVAVFTVDREGRVVTWNPAAERILGWSGEEAVGRPLAGIPEEELGAHEQLHAQLLRGETVAGTSTWRLRRDGTRVHLTLSAAPLCDEDGCISGYIATAADVTEQERALSDRETALRGEAHARRRAEAASARLSFLAEAGEILGASLEYETTLANLAGLVVPRLADWCAIDLVQEGAVRRVALVHRDEEKAECAAELQESYPPGSSPNQFIPRVLRTGEPLLEQVIPEGRVDSYARDPRHRELLDELGLSSYMAVPLCVDGRTLGAITLIYGTSGRTYDEDDLALALELARRAAQAVDRALAYRQLQSSERRASFLAAASRVLASSLEYETTLEQVARLAVPEFADWCFVDLLEEGGAVRTVAAAHADPEAEKVLWEIRRRFPLTRTSELGRWHSLDTGTPELVRVVSPERLERSIPDPEQRRLIGSLGPCSLIHAPLIARGRTLGVVSFVFGLSGRRYEETHLQLAEALAERAALAVDNARLYREAETAVHRFQDLVNGLEAVVWEADARTFQFTFVSRQAERLLGYPVEQWLEPGFWSSRLHPDDREEAVRTCTEATLDRRDHSMEYRMVAADGRPVWIRDLTRLALDERGEPSLLRGVMVDVTESRQAQEELRRSEERYRAFVTHGSEGIWRFEMAEPVSTSLSEDEQVALFYRHSYLAECNDAMARMYGFERAEQLIGVRLGELLPPEDPQNELFLRDFVRSGYSQVDVESHEIDRNGQLRYFLNTSVGMVEDGCLVRVWGTQRDVTERRRLEEQLRHSQKMEAVGRLAGGVAHDFNNMLAVITGYTELLLSGFQADLETRSQLQDIRKAAERAAALTRQLLAFSRREILSPRILDLNQVLGGMGTVLRRLLGDAVRLQLDLAPELPAVRADPGQVEQVLIHLVMYARDMMPDGGSVTITTRPLELGPERARAYGLSAGGHVRVTVADSDGGMEPDVASRIFEPFYTSRELGVGSGLGLAFVYGMVKQSGGHVEVESEPGEGTRFHVYLPAEREPAREPVPRKPGSLPGGSETVLLVEDEGMVRSLVREVLRLGGYTVLEAPHAEAARRLSADHAGPIHLLLTDVVLPGSSGKELAEWLVAERPDLRVLLMTGYTEDASVRNADEAGFQCIQKPFVPAELAERVRAALDACPAQPAAPPAA